MKKCRITVVRVTRYEDLMAQYENPISHTCGMEVWQVFIVNSWEKPERFCRSVWVTLSLFVLALSHRTENFYDGWMKNPKSAMLSCSDGFRPMSFFVKSLDGLDVSHHIECFWRKRAVQGSLLSRSHFKPI